MHASLKFGFYLPQLGLQPLADGLPQNREAPTVPLLRTDVRETEEVERFRFSLAAPVSISGREQPELDKPRLIGIQLQPELSEALLKLQLESFGIHLTLKAQHDIVGKSYDDDIAVSLLPSPCLNPEIKHVMQVDVRQERRCATP